MAGEDFGGDDFGGGSLDGGNDSGVDQALLDKKAKIKTLLDTIGLGVSDFSDSLISFKDKELDDLSKLIDGKEDKKELLKKILQENKGKEIIFEDVQKILSVKQESQTGDVLKNNNDSQKDSYMELKKQTDSIYSKLDLSKFPDFQKWQQESETALKQSNPTLALPENKDKLADLSKTLVLLNHQNDLVATYPNLKSNFEDLRKLTGGLPEFKNVDIDARFKDNPKVLKQEIDRAKELVPDNGQPLRFDGDKIITGGVGNDTLNIQVDPKNPNNIDISKFGYLKSIDVSQEGTDLLSLSQARQQAEEIEKQTKAISGNNEVLDTFKKSNPQNGISGNTINTLLSNPNLPSNLRGNLSKLQDTQDDLKVQESLYNSNNENSEITQELISSLKKDIKKQEQEIINQFTLLYNKTADQKTQNEKSIDEFNDIVSKNNNNSLTTKQRVQEKIQESEGALNFLHNIGITFMSQDQFNSLIEGAKSKINSGISGDFSIDKLASQEPGVSQYKYHQDLINFYNKLLGLEGTDAINPNKAADYVNSKSSPFTNPSFEQKVRETLFVKDRFIGKDVLNEKFGQDSKTDSPSEQPNQNK